MASPAWCRRLAELGGAQLRILPGAHNFCYAYPTLASQVIRELTETA